MPKLAAKLLRLPRGFGEIHLQHTLLASKAPPDLLRAGGRPRSCLSFIDAVRQQHACRVLMLRKHRSGVKNPSWILSGNSRAYPAHPPCLRKLSHFAEHRQMRRTISSHERPPPPGPKDLACASFCGTWQTAVLARTRVLALRLWAFCLREPGCSETSYMFPFS